MLPSASKTCYSRLNFQVSKLKQTDNTQMYLWS